MFGDYLMILCHQKASNVIKLISLLLHLLHERGSNERCHHVKSCINFTINTRLNCFFFFYTYAGYYRWQIYYENQWVKWFLDFIYHYFVVYLFISIFKIVNLWMEKLGGGGGGGGNGSVNGGYQIASYCITWRIKFT